MKNAPYTEVLLPETHEEWLAQRTLGLGGSDAGTILGLNPYSTPYSLWLQKTHRIVPSEVQNEACRQGHDFEQYVADRFTEMTGKKVHESPVSFVSKEYPWMRANVDRLLDDEEAGLECKTVSLYGLHDLEKGNIKPSYYCQCLHYMIVTGLPVWYICILPFQREPYVFRIDSADPAVAQDMQALIEAERDFWWMVENDVQPEIDGSSSASSYILALYPEADDKEADLSAYLDTAERLLELKSQIADLEAEKKACENQLKAAMKEADKGFVSETVWISYKNAKPRETMDTARFQRDNPDVYQKYIKVGKTSRRFVVHDNRQELTA